MSRCVNENCNKDPLNSINSIVVSIDGDFACSPECKAKYERQKAHFFNHIVHDEGRCERWLRGERDEAT